MSSEADDEPPRAERVRRHYTLRDQIRLVALAGLLLGGGVMWSRSAAYRAAAWFHAEQEVASIQSVQFYHDGTTAISSRIRRSIEVIEKQAKKVESKTTVIAGKDEGDFSSRLQEFNESLREMDGRWLRYLSERLSQDRNTLTYGLRRSAEQERLAGHHAALKRKYQRAAIFPWMPVEPDPPKPRIDD